MNAMPLPFEEFQGHGVFGFYSLDSLPQHQQQQFLLLHNHQNLQKLKKTQDNSCYYLDITPLEQAKSIIDNTTTATARSPNSILSSSSTLSSSCGGRTITATKKSLPVEKCGQIGMEVLESVLCTGASSQLNQEESVLGLVMGDLEDPSCPGLNKIQDLDQFGSGFGVVDQVFNFNPFEVNTNSSSSNNTIGVGDFPPLLAQNGTRIGSLLNQNQTQESVFGSSGNDLFLPALFQQQQQQQMFNPQMMNQAMFATPPPPKLVNTGPIVTKPPPQQQQRGGFGEELMVLNPLCQVAEAIENGNPILAQGILARLNQQLSLPLGKPFYRAAFYFKEAFLQLLLHGSNAVAGSSYNPSFGSLVSRIAAHKSFVEISPVVQFANFTCNQALLEAFEGADSIHIVDFGIGFGGQWASLMQELALRTGGAPCLKITAFVSSVSYDDLELGFTRENLKFFASEVNIPFELEIFSLESLNSGSCPIQVLENEVIAINLPVDSFSNQMFYLPLAIRFIRQISPKIVVSLDNNCDCGGLPFPLYINHLMQAYTALLESLDAVNMNFDALQKIEQFLIQPRINKLVLGHQSCPDKTVPLWRSLFLQCGFTPRMFSNFTETQAECLVQRTPACGFHIEKQQSSLILCWQRMELVAVSAWTC